MKRIWIFFLLVLAVSLQMQAQKLAPALTPETAGFSTQGLLKMEKEMQQWIANGWMQGGTALVIRNGKIVYHKAAGYKDLATKELMQKEHIFRIASQTKAITSVAIMILYEEGKLLLDDPVGKYIPSFRNQRVLDQYNAADTTWTTVPAKRQVTIRQLLTHTSGIGYAQIGTQVANAIYAKNNLTAGIGITNDRLADAMNRLGGLPLMHQPGEKWTYGLNTDLLGYIVEIVSGKTLDEFFRTRIFEPLGMSDTYFTIPRSKAHRLVKLYNEDSTGSLVKSTANLLNGQLITPDYPLVGSTYYSGGAGLSSTIYDYGVFLQMLLNGGVYNGKRILSRNSVRMMTMNQIGDLSLGDDKFGLGFRVVTEKGSAASTSQTGTYSWGGAFATSYWVDPKEKLVLLFYRQLQRTTHGDLPEKFKTMVYSAMTD
jgi:CubicO group peptidase (beta-lactamase class C family)